MPPHIIIVAGPNGAGKTSFIEQFLPLQRLALVYINADSIERELPQTGNKRSRELAAGRQMLRTIDESVTAGDSLIIETTLATKLYARRIKIWRHAGYSIALQYIRLPNADKAVERVRRRVLAGGHDIPEMTIRRRFAVSLEYLEVLYKPIVDEWYVWISTEGNFAPLESWEGP